MWIKELKMSYGYSSNLARCDDVKNGRNNKMKSRDFNIFIEYLLSIAFSYLPTHILYPLVDLRQFLKKFYSSTLREYDLIKMENGMSLILCMLERILSPEFFDSIENLQVHLAYEAGLRGHIQYKWIYPFER